RAETSLPRQRTSFLFFLAALQQTEGSSFGAGVGTEPASAKPVRLPAELPSERRGLMASRQRSLLSRGGHREMGARSEDAIVAKQAKLIAASYNVENGLEATKWWQKRFMQ
ncbi:hypothetical protein PybrP1_010594, partial [[Pythium] brassicae (nom. inval.)]